MDKMNKSKQILKMICCEMDMIMHMMGMKYPFRGG